MLWFGLKKRIDFLEKEIENAKDVIFRHKLRMFFIDEEIERLKQENERLKAVSDYWRNRACHKKQRSNRKAIWETTVRMHEENEKVKKC